MVRTGKAEAHSQRTGAPHQGRKAAGGAGGAGAPALQQRPAHHMSARPPASCGGEAARGALGGRQWEHRPLRAQTGRPGGAWRGGALSRRSLYCSANCGWRASCAQRAQGDERRAVKEGRLQGGAWLLLNTCGLLHSHGQALQA